MAQYAAVVAAAFRSTRLDLLSSQAARDIIKDTSYAVPLFETLNGLWLMSVSDAKMFQMHFNYLLEYGKAVTARRQLVTFPWRIPSGN